jgi:serine/threonine-protein kinase
MQPGQAVTPSIRLVRLLDQGSMGSIWVADHSGLGTQVAIKFMSPEMVDKPNLVARFSREAHAAAQIRSVHVVQVLDHGLTLDGTPYIAMELLEGESLQKRLRRVGRISPEQAARVVTPVCKALAKAHALGIVHRDIKPANIFLLESDDEVHCKLLDFGVAKAEGSDLAVTRTNEKVGTPFYMCPEQLISAKHVDYRADIWSIGVVAYHCVMGHVPFRANSFGDLCLAVSRGVFPLPSQANPPLSVSLDAWFKRTLVRDPKQRFDSARQAAEELERAVRLG